MRRLLVFLLVFLFAAPALAQKPAQGIAVVGIGSAREEAHVLARAVYASSLRPRALDEVRARVIAGDPAPQIASKETRDLAELRSKVTGDDAASRQLLAGIAKDLGVQGLLVLRVDESEVDGGTEKTESARLFLADSGDFDAARYEPEAGVEGPDAWKTTVRSLEGRFPAPAAPPPAQNPATHAVPPTMSSNEPPPSKPFYASAWFWGAVGAALLVGGAFYIASRDTSDDPIHLQMRVPR